MRIRPLLAVVALAAPLASGISAQTRTASPLPAFEVASVRLSPPGGGLTSLSSYPTNRFTAENMSLGNLLALAYDVKQDQIEGNPSWADSVFYNVTAKVEGDSKLTFQQMQPLLQQLLEQRLHLAVHRGKKDVRGYELVVAKGGPKLQENKGAPYLAYIMTDGLRAQDATMKIFAALLERPAGSPVVDKTGIEGKFDFKLNCAGDGAVDSPQPSVFSALQDQLGLKLVAQKITIETLVIDHVDKVPTDN